jgi:DNA-binding MarR family transcriptional regulator
MERGELVDALAQLSWHVQGQIAEAAAARGVSASLLRLLGILRDREPEMLELARHLQLDKSSVTGLVARAEGRGLVERAPGAGDRRTVIVRLTGEGRALAGELEREVQSRLGIVIDAMSARAQADLVAIVDTAVPHPGSSGSAAASRS